MTSSSTRAALAAVLAIALFPWNAGADELLSRAAARVLEEGGLTGDDSAAFRAALLASEDWQHELLDSGPLPKPGAAAGLLHEIWKADPALAGNPVDRGMATACALAGADRGWDAGRMTGRYLFFRDNWRMGRLNDSYGELSVFMRRYLANGVQHDRFNSLESMDYLLSEVCLPAEDYTGACWYAPYQGHNPFGDSVQGPHYYVPFMESWGSGAEMVRNIGGVCGGLSNFGAAAALANGVPAMTMGEPGHCAYAVLTRPDHWQPAYSLAWQRGLHYSFHGGTWSWHICNTDGYDNVPAARKSGDLRRAAMDLAEKRTHRRAAEILRQARRGHPADYQNWLASADFLEKAGMPDETRHDLHRDVMEKLAPRYPEVAWIFLRDKVYPGVLPKGGREAPRRVEILAAYHRALNGWGAGRWDLAAAIRGQMDLISKNPAERDRFALACAGAHIRDAALLPAVLDAQFADCGKDSGRKTAFMRDLALAMSKTDGKGEDFQATVTALADRLLPEAAASGDRTTFQFIGRLASESYKPSDVKAEPFPGDLLSSGGALSVSGAGNRWDRPHCHWGVIEPHGGDFHTGGKPATATIALGHFGRLSGVVIVQRSGHLGRVNGARLQVSEDGTTWKDVHRFEKAGRILRIDLSGGEVDAGFVRVIQDSRDEPIHFHRFLVYGKRRS